MTGKNKVQKTRIQEKNKAAANSTTPLPPQESNNKQELLEFVQNEYVAQSRTLSNVTRTVAGVLLGTIWAICYKEEEVKIPNIWFAISLILSSAFFVVELLHYFIDSIFYHNKSDLIVKSRGNFDYEKEYGKIQCHSRLSFWFLNIKSVIVLFLCGVFIWGVISLYKSHCTKTRNTTATIVTTKFSTIQGDSNVAFFNLNNLNKVNIPFRDTIFPAKNGSECGWKS